VDGLSAARLSGEHQRGHALCIHRVDGSAETDEQRKRVSVTGKRGACQRIPTELVTLVDIRLARERLDRVDFAFSGGEPQRIAPTTCIDQIDGWPELQRQ